MNKINNEQKHLIKINNREEKGSGKEGKGREKDKN